MVVLVDVPLIFLITLFEIDPVAGPLWKIPAVSVLALLPAFVRFAIVLPEKFSGPKVVVVIALFIPYTLEETDEVVANEEKRLFDVVELPIVLFVTVTLAVLDTAMPSILAPCVEVPTAVREPMTLLLMFTIAGLNAEELIPTMAPREPGVSVIAPFPVPAPIVLGLDVPMFALPDVILIPQSAPPDVFEVLVDVTLMLVIVFP